MKITADVAAEKARALRAALATARISLKHTRALDLVCASYGLRSRGVLASAPEGTAAPHRQRLDQVLDRVARQDAARRAAILSATTAITHPSRVMAVVTRFGASFGAPATLHIQTDVPRDPRLFLKSQAGETALREIASGYFYTRWYKERSEPAMSLKTANEVAARILHRQPDTQAEEALLDALGFGEEPEDVFDHQGRTRITSFLAALDEALDDHGYPPLDDHDAWEEALAEAVIDELVQRDDSKVEDLVDGHDKAEIIFVFGDPMRPDFESNCLTATGNGLSIEDIVPNAALRDSLAAIGYRLSEYRRLSGNRAPTEGVVSRRPVRPDRLVPWTAVKEAVDNACSSYAALVLYAQIPIGDLMRLDPKQPIRFKTAAFASYNPMSGTFFGSFYLDDVVVEPRHGFLSSCAGWYGPDEICGLVPSYYAGRLSNTEAERAPRNKETHK